MFDNLTEEKLDEFLLSLNLINSNDIKKVKKTLYGISNNIYFFYREFNKSKKNGNKRKISAPNKMLKNIQKNILNNVLIEKKISKYATAYQRGKSLIDNVSIHTNKKVVLKLDIKNFFDNITFMKVYRTCFNEQLYPKKIGMLLTNLCMYDERLPQGAVTSCAISNIVMRDFDEKLGKWCVNKDISFTRYSDDLTFSGDFNYKEVINYVKKLLNEKGFILNKEKIVLVTKRSKQLVTGIVVNEKVNISKEYKDKIRQEIYYIKKYGLKSHMDRTKIDINEISYLTKLLGRINFVNFIIKDNKEFIDYKKYVLNLIKKYKKMS